MYYGKTNKTLFNYMYRKMLSNSNFNFHLMFFILFVNCFLPSINLAASTTHQEPKNKPDSLEKKISSMLTAATNQVGVTTTYNAAYQKIKYPMGDVPIHEGVCTDVIIRAMRAIGIDLQKEVHDSMRLNRAVYPKKWGVCALDTNIDHRRVPNLVTFFKLKGMEVAGIDKKYQAGDIVVWDLETGQYHIGILSDKKTPDNKSFLVIHNISCGVKIEDILNSYSIVAHFRLLRR